LIAADGEDVDGAALRGLQAALDRLRPHVNAARVVFRIEPSKLWHWRGTIDSPSANSLDLLAAMPERNEWDEILLVVPTLNPQPAGVPPVRRGAGIFVDRAAGPHRDDESARQSAHLSIKVWRFSARSLAAIASEDIVTSVELAHQPAALLAAPTEAAWSRLNELIETSVESAALRLLQVNPVAIQAAGAAAPARPGRSRTSSPRAAEEQNFPLVEVSARRLTCPALQWRWYDAIASAYEQRHLGSSLLVPTRFDEALRSAAAISREAVARGCLVKITRDCAEDRAEEQGAVADSGDSWRERDVPEELQARGVSPDFIEREFPYFGHPERCRP